MGELSSFYGGRRGFSFVLAKTFDGYDIPEGTYGKAYYAVESPNGKFVITDREHGGNVLIDEVNNKYLIKRDSSNYSSQAWWTFHDNDGSLIDDTTYHFPIVYAQGLKQCFEKGAASLNEVAFSDYVIIDSVVNMCNWDDPDNGKIYQRGGDPNNMYKEKYICQITGPKGDTIVNYLDHYSNVTEAIDPETHEPLPYLDITYDEANEDLIQGKEGNVYNDTIHFAYRYVYNSLGNIEKCLIGFKLPTLVEDFEGKSISPYENRQGSGTPQDPYVDVDLISEDEEEYNSFKQLDDTAIFDANIDYYILVNNQYVIDETVTAQNFEQKIQDGLYIRIWNHPFYQKWNIKIPHGYHGINSTNFELVPTKTKPAGFGSPSFAGTQAYTDIALTDPSVLLTDSYDTLRDANFPVKDNQGIEYPDIMAVMYNGTKLYVSKNDCYRNILRYRETNFDNLEAGEVTYYELDYFEFAHRIVDQNGYELEQRSKLAFDGKQVEVTDDPIHDTTRVNVLRQSGSYFGIMATGQSSLREKNVTISADQDFRLQVGTVINIKFEDDNSYSVTENNPITLNINNSGAKPIYYQDTGEYLGTEPTAYGRQNHVNQYIYDGTFWVWTGSSVDNNTTYSTMSTNELLTGTADDQRVCTADNLKPGIIGLTGVGYGTCSTEANVASKVIIIADSNWRIRTGAIVGIKFTNTNTAQNPTFNVNDSGAKPVFSADSVVTTERLNTAGNAGYVIYYMFDGTNWCFINWGIENDTTYTPESLGIGYGICDTAASTTAKVATLSGYNLVQNGVVAIQFDNAVSAGSTLNINNQGAKPILYKGVAIVDKVIKAGNTATFYYDGTSYQLVAVDNPSGGHAILDTSKTEVQQREKLWFKDALVSDDNVEEATTIEVMHSPITLAEYNSTHSLPDGIYLIEDDIPNEGGHIILNSSGTEMPTRRWLQFNNLTISDDELGNKTIVTKDIIQSDWNQTTTTAEDYIKNKPPLATVATSGSYNDLSDKPTIPTVNNATLTIQKNGTTVKTFTANASSDVICNITVPTNTNELTNGAGFITSSGTAANVSGTVAIANGGTGATTRLNAVKALTNENVGTSAQYFLTITNNWAKAGYSSLADIKSALGINQNKCYIPISQFVSDTTVGKSWTTYVSKSVTIGVAGTYLIITSTWAYGVSDGTAMLRTSVGSSATTTCGISTSAVQNIVYFDVLNLSATTYTVALQANSNNASQIKIPNYFTVQCLLIRVD